MRRTSYARANCPVARSLDRIGDAWTLLIVRDVFYGLRRFEELQESLGITPTTLTRRLRALVKGGLLVRKAYQARPRRYEYRLTAMSEDLLPVLLQLLAWGNRHFAPDGPLVEVARAGSGAIVQVIAADAATGEEIRGPAFKLVAGTGASKGTRARMAARGAAVFGR